MLNRKLKVIFSAIMLIAIVCTGCKDDGKAKIQLEKEYERIEKEKEKKQLAREIDSLKNVLKAKKDSVAKALMKN